MLLAALNGTSIRFRVRERERLLENLLFMKTVHIFSPALTLGLLSVWVSVCVYVCRSVCVCVCARLF